MFVHIPTEALVAFIISGDVDPGVGSRLGLLSGAELGIDEQARGAAGFLFGEVGLNRAVIGNFGVVLEEAVDPGERVLPVRAEIQIGSIALDAGIGIGDDRIDLGFVLRAEGIIAFLDVSSIGVLGQHVEEVLADRFAGWSHELSLNVEGEIPAVVVDVLDVIAIGIGVIGEDFIKGLQGKRLAVEGFVAVPFLRNVVDEISFVDHLGLDLGAVLDERHREVVGSSLDVVFDLGKDLVVLRLSGFNYKVEVFVIFILAILDEGRGRGRGTGGVGDHIEGPAIDFLHGFLVKLLLVHGHGLFHDFLGMGLCIPVSTGASGERPAKQSGRDD